MATLLERRGRSYPVQNYEASVGEEQKGSEGEQKRKEVAAEAWVLAQEPGVDSCADLALILLFPLNQVSSLPLLPTL